MRHSFRIQCPAYYKKFTYGVNKCLGTPYTLHQYEVVSYVIFVHLQGLRIFLRNVVLST